ncbi:MAG: hypothetical protein HQL31_01240 [Planctomycetes bacterium]|nr:hypothetical protein [Planctomycetota bacterium]
MPTFEAFCQRGITFHREGLVVVVAKRAEVLLAWAYQNAILGVDVADKGHGILQKNEGPQVFFLQSCVGWFRPCSLSYPVRILWMRKVKSYLDINNFVYLGATQQVGEDFL